MEKTGPSSIGARIRQSVQLFIKGFKPGTISFKLNAISTIAVTGMIILGLVSILMLTRLEKSYEQVSVLYTQGQRTDQLLNLIFKTIVELDGVVHEGEDTSSEVLALNEEMLAAFSAYKSSAEQAGLAEDLSFAVENEPVFLKIRELAFQTLSLYRSGAITEAQEVKEQVDQNAQHILVFVEDSASRRQQALADQFAELAALRGRLLIIQIGVFSLGAVLVSTLAFVISRGISKHIGALTAGAERVGAGDLAAQVEVGSDDEIGLLATTFNQMLARLRELLHNEQAQHQHLQLTVQQYVDYMAVVGQGNLSARLALNEGNGREDDPLIVLGRNLNETVDKLQQMITLIRDAANNLTSSAAEILAAITQQASGANEQSAAISQASTTIDEVRIIAEQTAQRAKGVADLAQQTDQVSLSGRQAVTDTIVGVGTVKDKVERIATEVLALSEQAQAIGTIIASVNEVAAQSNMLALNAAVEAARAGKAGRGFAVVAQEVRSLAEQSRMATAQVKEILTLIRRGMDAAVRTTEEGIKGADEGVNLAGEAGSAIQNLAEGVTASSQAAVQIAAAASQQQAGMEQIAAVMANISQVTAQNVIAVQQVEESAQGLNQLAGQLQQLVEQYEL